MRGLFGHPCEDYLHSHFYDANHVKLKPIESWDEWTSFIRFLLNNEHEDFFQRHYASIFADQNTTLDEFIYPEASKRNQPFALWKNGKIIGTTNVTIDYSGDMPEALFGRSFIHPSQRGKGYAAQLHHGRLDYLGSIGFRGYITTYVQDRNEPSWRAVEKAGFESTNQFAKSGARIWMKSFGLEQYLQQ